MVACYVFGAVFIFFILGRESTSHCPVEAETDEKVEVCTMNRVWNVEQGRQRMCWRMVLELFSVEAFCHQFGQCLHKICSISVYVLNRF